MRSIPVFLFSAFFALWAFSAQGQSIQSSPNNFTPCGNGCYEFWLSNGPWPIADYHYFWNFGDGTYSFDERPVHKFLSTNPTTVSLEIIKRYDDDDEPDKYAAPITPGSSGTEPKTMTTSLEVLNNRDAKINDSITYIIEYGKLCDRKPEDPEPSIKLTFDDSKMDYEGFASYNGESGPSTSTGTIEFSDLVLTGSKAKRIFVTFKVANLTEGTPVDLTYELIDSADPTCNVGPSDLELEAVLSHDPNYIEAEIDEICGPAESGDKITYRIHFQNVGKGTANEVVVRTFVPTFFKSGDPTDINTTWPSGANHSLQNGELIWTLNTASNNLKGSIGLKGKADPGYGVTVFEPETKEYIEYELEFKPGGGQLFDPCVTIVNQAEIVFDCNPPILTNFYGTDIVCFDPNAVDSCECLLKPPLFQAPTTFLQSTSVSLDASAYGTDVVWYPPAYFASSGPLIPVANVSPARSIEYVACLQRMVVRGNYCIFQRS